MDDTVIREMSAVTISRWKRKAVEACDLFDHLLNGTENTENLKSMIDSIRNEAYER